MSIRWQWALTRDLSDAEWLVAKQTYGRLLEGLTAMVQPPFPFAHNEKVGFFRKVHGQLTRKLHTPPYEQGPETTQQLELWGGPNARPPGQDPAWNAAIFPKLSGEYSIDAAGGLHELVLMGWLAALNRQHPGTACLTGEPLDTTRWEEALAWASEQLEQTLHIPSQL